MTKRKDPKDILPAGRPPVYTDEIADTICIRLSMGESLRRICMDKDMPSQQTVYSWIYKNPSFLEKYTRAREEQAETHFDILTDIADETPETVPVFDREGNQIDVKLDSAYIAWQKQRIDARKWAAMKLKPKKYGDKIVHAGDDANPVVMEHSMDIFGQLLEIAKQERQAEK